jgi:hypothetical protein
MELDKLYDYIIDGGSDSVIYQTLSEATNNFTNLELVSRILDDLVAEGTLISPDPGVKIGPIIVRKKNSSLDNLVGIANLRRSIVFLSKKESLLKQKDAPKQPDIVEVFPPPFTELLGFQIYEFWLDAHRQLEHNPTTPHFSYLFRRLVKDKLIDPTPGKFIDFLDNHEKIVIDKFDPIAKTKADQRKILYDFIKERITKGQLTI